MANLANPQAMRSYLIGPLGYTPAQSAALLGNIQQESGFDPNNLNKGEGAYGLLQWRGDRLTGLQNYAASKGTSPSDWQTQLEYARNEMSGPEARNASGFLNAQSLPQANAALHQYIRYGDNSEPTRLQYAQGYMDNGQQQPQSYAGMSNPPLTPGSPAPQLPTPINIGGMPQIASAMPTMPGAPQQQQQPQQQPQQQLAGLLAGIASPQQQQPAMPTPTMAQNPIAQMAMTMQRPNTTGLQALLQNNPRLLSLLQG